MSDSHPVPHKFLLERKFSLLDLLPEGSFSEKVIGLALNGIPSGMADGPAGQFRELLRELDCATADLRLVVFGGGTGLSNIVGGDSRRPGWKARPFTGLKEIFSRISSVVCVTDDGGSTGELLKDLPLIALGDLRHVLLSSIRRNLLQTLYNLDALEAETLASSLHSLFNYRFVTRPASAATLLKASGADVERMPAPLAAFLTELCSLLFSHPHLQAVLERPHCLGNLLLAASIYQYIDPEKNSSTLPAEHEYLRTATSLGLMRIATSIGAQSHAVLPCTASPAQLQVLYTNGVLVTGESKSAQAVRGYPVERVCVHFPQPPFLLPEVVAAIRQADIMVFAPGSLYSSIIPIFQLPELVEEVRASPALKLLISNIWVQKGETDTARDDPGRKYHVSDLLKAYDRNIPGGVRGLFSHVLGLDMGDIPGSVLQNYGLENKEPIYFDRPSIRELGLEPVAARIFSSELLRERAVIQHDPRGVALTVKTLWALHRMSGAAAARPRGKRRQIPAQPVTKPGGYLLPCERYRSIVSLLQLIEVEVINDHPGLGQILTGAERKAMIERMTEIIWSHPDIRPDHLRFICGLTLIDAQQWQRCQTWDNVFSFYDPLDQQIKIRSDLLQSGVRFEMALLVALGQSLLGNYARSKRITPIEENGEVVGRMYTMILRDGSDLQSFFTRKELDVYLRIVRMQRSTIRNNAYKRLINGDEGFTPPGLLFGLFFAWYLDNRFAANVEYKMSIMRSQISDLIPEQIRLFQRREELITFFRETVFGLAGRKILPLRHETAGSTSLDE